MKNFDRESIDNDENGILIEDNGSKRLLVTFGGISQGMGMPTFEFFNSLKKLDCDKIFFRDFNQMWYQKGVDETLDSIEKIKDFLEKKISEGGYQNVCFIGNSMGGYAAILFGAILNIKNIISFTPQTFINRKKRLFNFDFRWKKQIKRVYKNPNSEVAYFDLKNYLKDINYTSEIDVYYSSKHRLDKIHAEQMQEIKGFTMKPIKEGGHNIIKMLRDSGQLQLILEAKLTHGKL